MIDTVVTAKGQIVIPSKIRRRLNIKKGTRLCVIERENEIILRPLTAQYFENMAGVLNTKGKDLQELIEERVKDKKEREVK